MRSIHVAAALVVSLFATAGNAHADDAPLASEKPKKVVPAPAPKKTTTPKKVAIAKKTPKPAPKPLSAKEPEAEPAPEPTLNAPEDAEPAPAAKTAPVAKPRADAPADADRETEESPVTAKPFSVAPLLSVASGAFRYGIGARAGYTLPSRIYLGAAFMYQLGDALAADYSLPGYDSGVSRHQFYPSVEGGYELRVGPVNIRPYAGVALVFLTVSTDIGPLKGSETTHSLALYPGAAVSYDIPKTPIFIGGDARVVLNFDVGTSFALSAVAGVRF